MSLGNTTAAERERELDATSATGENGEGKEPKEVSEGVVNTKVVCRVCKHFYRDPKILPCLHSFCAECIRLLEPFSVSVVNGKDDSGQHSPLLRDQQSVTVLCPECDSEVDLPPAGVDGLTTDHLALDEVFQETVLSANHELVCDLCSEGNAEKRCAVCSANLCEFCCQAHRRQKKTSSHSVQRLRDLKAQGRLSRPVLCPTHPGEELQLFCESCDLALCRQCAAAAHRDHQCGYARELVGRHGDRIRQLLRGVHPRLRRLEEAARGVERSQGALQARADAVAQQVERFCGAYLRAVQEHCQALLQQVEAVRAHRRAQLHLQRAQLDQALADARAGVEFAERLLTCGTELEILTAKGVVSRRLALLADDGRGLNAAAVAPDDGNLCFLPQERAGEVGGYPMFGVVLAKTVDPSKCLIHGEGLQRGREGQRGEFTLLCRDSAGEPMGRGGEAVLVSIVHKDKKECVVEATVADNGDGSYGVSYVPAEPGPYSVWVCVKAQHVKGSPFVLAVQRKFRRHRGTFHCCSFCSSRGAKDARCGCGGSMPGGYQGCGHGHRGHPGRPHWSCCGSVLEGSECVRPGGGIPCSPRSVRRTVEL
ncbi:tripartite motif-containing protein 45 [Anguilla anguilla]|uniref:tripartite motif-containing protein 45 n=1 Tax=Anguilla anguilla TaxID=7936 RepID=UPI0015B12DDC|nr:tripartite motif-containing protein 45 [Anguilla anguilla]